MKTKQIERMKVEAKTYKSVPEMVRDMSDPEFAESFEKRIAEKAIITRLMTMRAAANLSQKDIAQKMKCTQSRISKLESGKDEDLRIGDFHAYAEGVGLQLIFIMGKKGRRPLVKLIQHHFSALRRLFSELQELAGKDDTTKAGMWKFILANLHSTTDAVSDLMKDISDNIGQEVHSSHPAAIQIEVECDDEVNEEKESTSKPSPRRVIC